MDVEKQINTIFFENGLNRVKEKLCDFSVENGEVFYHGKKLENKEVLVVDRLLTFLLMAMDELKNEKEESDDTN